jgi:hypothetical protein
LLPRQEIDAYDAPVADSKDIRRLRVEKTLWDAFTEVVGNGGRSAEIKSFLLWRVNNPTTPLPGNKLGPIKKVRKRSDPEEAAGDA